MFSLGELLFLLELTPCALVLYHWLVILLPDGAVGEVWLEDFCTFTQTDGRKGYSMKWVKNALQELVSCDLVSIEKRYNSQIFKLRVWKPGQRPTT
jgi:hypothetical protein